MPRDITAKDIEELRAEAAEAGDEHMVHICDQALDINDPNMYEAREKCARVIEEAQTYDSTM